MPRRKSLGLGFAVGVLALPFALIAQTSARSEVVQTGKKSGEKITCPFETECQVSGVAFSVLNDAGTAIEGGGKNGVIGNSGDPDGAGVAGFGDAVGVNGFGSTGPGVVAISKGDTLFKACFNTIGFGCNNGNAVRIDSAGTVFANGGFQTGGADVAEFVAASGVEPGDVVEIDRNHAGEFRRASHRASTAVAGVISTTPGVTMNSPDAANGTKDAPRLALAGRVQVKATAANGRIRPGDLLVSSATPGYAMRAGNAPRPGTVFGKALGSLEHGEGLVEMLVWAR
jgi:hypothetical protein